jgi:hypothetical protein
MGSLNINISEENIERQTFKIHEVAVANCIVLLLKKFLSLSKPNFIPAK